MRPVIPRAYFVGGELIVIIVKPAGIMGHEMLVPDEHLSKSIAVSRERPYDGT